MFRAVMLTCAAGVVIIVAHFGRREVQERSDLTLVDQGHISTLDPHQASSSSDMRLCTNLWEGLASYDPLTLAPVSGMATLPPQISDQGTTYTFELRSDSRWSNGDALRAGDFERGWRRALEPGSAGDYSTVLTRHIAGAADYYRWRSQAVTRLQQLAVLAEGGTLNPQVEKEFIAELAPFGAATARTPQDWRSIRESYWRDHAARRPQRWEQVGIRTVGARRLQVRLTRPTSYFCDLLLLPVMVPLHESIERLRQGDPDTGLDEHGLVIYDSRWTRPDYHDRGYPGVVTNGAYGVRDWQFRRRLRLEVNPHHYFAANCGCRVIDVLMFEDANTAFLAYETGVVDWLVVLGVDCVDELLRLQREGRRPDIRLTPAFGTYFYNLNCRDSVLPDGRPNPFVDVRVRRAFSLAVDRQALCRSVVLKANPPAWTLVPPGSIPDYPAVQGLDHDPVQARRLLDEAGYTARELFPPVAILYNSGFDHQRIAEALAHMWEQTLGVRVDLLALEPKTFWSEKARHNFLIARGGWYGDYPDPTTFLDICLTGNGNNDSGFSSAAYDELLNQAAESADRSERLALLARAEDLLVREDIPIIPLFQYTNPTAVRDVVSGLHLNAREIYPYRYLEARR
jgi:oligopeptide transport system substrate-binding protein